MNEQKIRVQVEHVGNGMWVGCTSGVSFGSATSLLFPYMPALIAPKVVLLRTAGRDVVIKGVGRQALPNVFYVVTTPSEWTQLIKEADHESSTRFTNQSSV